MEKLYFVWTQQKERKKKNRPDSTFSRKNEQSFHRNEVVMSQYCGSFLHKGLSTHFCALAQGTFKRRINGKNINTHTYCKVANRSTSPLVVPQRIFRPCLYQRVTYSDLLGKKLIFETAARSTVRNFMIFYFLGQTNWIQKHIPN